MEIEPVDVSLAAQADGRKVFLSLKRVAAERSDSQLSVLPGTSSLSPVSFLIQFASSPESLSPGRKSAVPVPAVPFSRGALLLAHYHFIDFK